jgi:hypothetical protein
MGDTGRTPRPEWITRLLDAADQRDIDLVPLLWQAQSAAGRAAYPHGGGVVLAAVDWDRFGNLLRDVLEGRRGLLDGYPESPLPHGQVHSGADDGGVTIDS